MDALANEMEAINAAAKVNQRLPPKVATKGDLPVSSRSRISTPLKAPNSQRRNL